ncbi:F-box protein Pof2 [Schizosaccharomyces japonicus yFS275]|uniref:F-box protein Pof2 n=1 Tax=Schizosaccharomyces japonicus (strain yFS275 / FY16936) TaxID=402676 RepID=B6JW80_SCHJY|nr:F-box protein Pof2 [Schizosaccharomyces japonicus yFS275]EEB05631.1 F-box protein Pof2 [Schizosaccharomyces japonicus yFS275]
MFHFIVLTNTGEFVYISRNPNLNFYPSPNAAIPTQTPSIMCLLRPNTNKKLLPDEVIFQLFSYLEIPELLVCQRVCRKWLNFCSVYLWHKVAFASEDSFKEFYRYYIKTGRLRLYEKWIRKLNLSHASAYVFNATILPFSRLTNLVRLNLSNCAKVPELKLIVMLHNNPGLIALELSSIPSITNMTLFTVCTHCPSIKGLNVSNCPRIDDTGVVHLLQHCRGLRRLRIADCHLLTNATLEAIATFGDLIELDISGCFNIESADLLYRLFETNKQLRDVNFSRCSNVMSSFRLRHLNTAFPSVRYLNLSESSDVDDEILNGITRSFPNLQSLYLAKCSRVTNIGVDYITRLAPSLTFLHLAHCFDITDDGVAELTEKCQKLVYVDFGGCVQITDNAVNAISRLPKLQRGIQRLILTRKNLTHLSVTGITSVLNSDLTHFSRPVPRGMSPSQAKIFCALLKENIDAYREYLENCFKQQPPLNGLNGYITEKERLGMFRETA